MMNELYLLNTVSANQSEVKTGESHVTFSIKNNKSHLRGNQQVLHHRQYSGKVRVGEDLEDSGDSSSSLETIVERATEGSYILDSSGEPRSDVISPYLDIHVGGSPLGPSGSALALDKLKRTQSFKGRDLKRDESMKKGLRRQTPIVLRKSIGNIQSSSVQRDPDITGKPHHVMDSTSRGLSLTVPETNVKGIDKDDGYDSPSTFSSDVTSSTNTSLMVSPGTQPQDHMIYSTPERPDTLPGLDSPNLEHLRMPAMNIINAVPHQAYHGIPYEEANTKLSYQSYVGVNHIQGGSNMLSHQGSSGDQDYYGRSGEQTYPEYHVQSYDQPGGIPQMVGHHGDIHKEYKQEISENSQKMTNWNHVNSPQKSPGSYPDVVRHGAIKTEFGYVETNKITGFKAMNAQLRESVRLTGDLKLNSKSAPIIKRGGQVKQRSVEDKLKDLVLWSGNPTDLDLENVNITIPPNDSSIKNMVKSWESRGPPNLMDMTRAGDITSKQVEDYSIGNNNSFPDSEIANNNCRVNQYGQVNQSSDNCGLIGKSSQCTASKSGGDNILNIQVVGNRQEINTSSLSQKHQYSNNPMKRTQNSYNDTLRGGTMTEKHAAEYTPAGNASSFSDNSVSNGNNKQTHIAGEYRHQSEMTQPRPYNTYSKGTINTPVTSHSTDQLTFTERACIDPISRDQSQLAAVPRRGLGEYSDITADSGSIHYSGEHSTHVLNGGNSPIDDTAVRQVATDLNNCCKDVVNHTNVNSKQLVHSDWGAYTIYPPLKGIGSPRSYNERVRGHNARIYDTQPTGGVTQSNLTTNSLNVLDSGDLPDDNINSKKVRFQLDLHGNHQHTTHYINKDTHSPIDCPNHLYNSSLFNTKSPVNMVDPASSQNDLNKVSVSDQSHSQLSKSQINIETRPDCIEDSNQQAPKPAIKVRTLADIKAVPAKLVISQNIPTTSSQTVYLDLVQNFTTSTAVAAKRTMAKNYNDVVQQTGHVGYTDKGQNFTPVTALNQGDVSKGSSNGINSGPHFDMKNNKNSSPNQWNTDTSSVSKKSLYMRNVESKSANYQPHGDHPKMYHSVVQVNNFRESVEQSEQRRRNTSHRDRTESKHEHFVNNWVKESTPELHNNTRDFRMRNEAPVSRTDIHERPYEKSTGAYSGDDRRLVAGSIGTGQDECDSKKIVTPSPKVVPPRQPPSYEEYIRKKHHHHQLNSDVYDRDPGTDHDSTFQGNNRLRSSVSDPNIAEWLQQSSHTYKYNNLLSKSSTTLHTTAAAVSPQGSRVNDLQIVSIEQRRMESFRSQKGPVYATTCEIYQMLASRRGNPLAMKSPYYKHFAESSL